MAAAADVFFNDLFCVVFSNRVSWVRSRIELCLLENFPFYAPILIWAGPSVCLAVSTSVRNAFWQLGNLRTVYAKILKCYMWHVHEK